MLRKARLVRAFEGSPAAAAGSRSHLARKLARSQLEAYEAAEQIRGRAQQQAEQMLREARESADALRTAAHEEGLAQGLAEATARCVLLSKLESERDERALDRSVQVSRVLAERLLGAALQVDPSLVTQLATQVLSEVRGANRATLFVSPTDHPILTQQLDEQVQSAANVQLRVDDRLAPGDFRLSTDVGTLDASLGSRLQILCQKLRESLRP